MSCSGIGDGYPATAANLVDPGQGVFDKFGNYYFVEPTGHRIRKIDTAGIINTVAGDGSPGFAGDGMAAALALINEPDAVIVDTLGNYYIADVGNERIRKVEISTGVISTIVGNGTGAFYGEGIPATDAEIWDPYNICFDRFGNLYIVDGFNYRVRKVNTSGIISTFAGTGSTSLSGTGDGGPATAATFAIITGVAADDTGNIYVADLNAGKVRKVSTSGIISTFAGNGNVAYAGDGMPAITAQMAPENLVFDSDENLIISDRYNKRVYKITTDGIFHSIAGIGGAGIYSGDGGPAASASLDPGGAAFDLCGNLYIPDINNVRIRKVTYHAKCNLDNLKLTANQVNSSPELTFYPNPAYTTVTISATTKISQVTITNPLGQIVYSQSYDIEKAEINIAGLPEGVYIVKVKDGEGKVTVSKIIKQ